MGWTALNNKWINLATVLSEICIGINERRAAIDVTLIDFVIDRDSNTATYPDPEDFDLRFYGQEFADIQQQITDDIMLTEYTSSTGGTVTYTDAIPGSELVIETPPVNPIDDTLDPLQWAWYITELNNKIYVQIEPSINSDSNDFGSGSTYNPANYNTSWGLAVADVGVSPSPTEKDIGWSVSVSGFPLVTIAAGIRDNLAMQFETSEYTGTLSNGALKFEESAQGTFENRSMDYTINSTGYTSNTSAVPANVQTRTITKTPIQGTDTDITASIDAYGATSPYNATGSVIVTFDNYTFYSDISGELTDQA